MATLYQYRAIQFINPSLFTDCASYIFTFLTNTSQTLHIHNYQLVSFVYSKATCLPVTHAIITPIPLRHSISITTNLFHLCTHKPQELKKKTGSIYTTVLSLMATSLFTQSLQRTGEQIRFCEGRRQHIYFFSREKLKVLSSSTCVKIAKYIFI